VSSGIPRGASETLARAIGSARNETLGKGIVREQADLLIEHVVESYQRQIAELEKDIFNWREIVIWLNEVLTEKRGGN